MEIIDCFCGGGGLSHGLTQAGHHVLAAFDWWQPALDFYNHNIHDHQAFQMDLSNVDESVRTIGRYRPECIVGGPPCQDFSSAGNRDENGGRASLTTSYAAIVTAVHPRMFVMENVERAIKTRTYRKALQTFKEAGYELAVAVLDASLCGAPQARKRIVVVGGRHIDMAPLIDIYRRNHADRPMTLADYMGDELHGLQYYYRHPRSYARRGIFSVNEPSATIRGVNRPVPQGYPGHPGDAAPVNAPGLRQLTTRERSRIQTFPAEWELVGRQSHVEQIIGNAVPCALGEFVGNAIEEFDHMPHHRVNQANIDTHHVTVYSMYAEDRPDDMRVVDLDELD